MIKSLPVATSVPFDNSGNGFVSTDVQAAILETATKLTATEVNSATTVTTTSTTDVLLTSMTISPAVGAYLVFFGTTISSNTAGAVITVSFYVGGVQKADSVRKISPFDGGSLSSGSARGTVDINGAVSITSGQTLEVRWSMSAGTATCGPRTMNLLRVL